LVSELAANKMLKFFIFMLLPGFARMSARYEEIENNTTITITVMIPIMSDQVRTDVWVPGEAIVVVDAVAI
jgi:hypothetical protein